MTGAAVDYARFGRQIALPELGADGQRAIGATAVRFEPDDPLAREAHARAGGLVRDDAAVVVALPAGPRRAVAAWASIEATRRLLGEDPQVIPQGLLARLEG